MYLLHYQNVVLQKDHLDSVFYDLADEAFEDQCTTANPRLSIS